MEGSKTQRLILFLKDTFKFILKSFFIYSFFNLKIALYHLLKQRIIK